MILLLTELNNAISWIVLYINCSTTCLQGTWAWNARLIFHFSSFFSHFQLFSVQELIIFTGLFFPWNSSYLCDHTDLKTLHWVIPFSSQTFSDFLLTIYLINLEQFSLAFKLFQNFLLEFMSLCWDRMG